jgi:hypothetical protein
MFRIIFNSKAQKKLKQEVFIALSLTISGEFEAMSDANYD